MVSFRAATRFLVLCSCAGQLHAFSTCSSFTSRSDQMSLYRGPVKGSYGSSRTGLNMMFDQLATAITDVTNSAFGGKSR